MNSREELRHISMKKKILGLTILFIAIIGIVVGFMTRQNVKKTEDPAITPGEMEFHFKLQHATFNEWKKWDAHHPNYRREVSKKGNFTCYSYISRVFHDPPHDPWVITYIVKSTKDTPYSYYGVSVDGNGESTTLEEYNHVYKITTDSERLVKGSYQIIYTAASPTKKEFKKANDPNKDGYDEDGSEEPHFKNQQDFTVTLTRK